MRHTLCMVDRTTALMEGFEPTIEAIAAWLQAHPAEAVEVLGQVHVAEPWEDCGDCHVRETAAPSGAPMMRAAVVTRRRYDNDPEPGVTTYRWHWSTPYGDGLGTVATLDEAKAAADADLAATGWSLAN